MGKTILAQYREKVEKYIDKVLPSDKKEPKILHEAMRHSVFSGGKRLRPVIVLAVGDIAGVEHEKLMPVACGLELLHNFSLVHDDLPAMDDDDYRRGKLTCHKKFGEAVAILAGDALLTLAFEVISETGNCPLVKAVAGAIGSEGMAGGQAFDILFKEKQVSDALKKKINEKKTGRLFQICFEAPFYFKKVPGKEKTIISRMARNFGEAFQLRDDMEDKEGNAEQLGEKIEALYKRIKKDISFFRGKGMLLDYLNDRLFKNPL
ncbi:MAG TPA: polyprenyl synthetase family protein [bacterium]|nr:polyprenyl synthetase family protein [bacterium]